MQSRVARLILLCLFLIAISTAAFLFWKGDTAATAGALDARSFDSSARIAERAVLDLRAAQLGYAIAGQPADRSVARVAQQLDAARTNIQALRAMTKVAEVTSALDAASAALNEFTRSDKRAAEYARNDQRLLASDVVLGDGLERTESALTAIEQARSAEAQAREAGISVYRSRQVFALAAGARRCSSRRSVARAGRKACGAVGCGGCHTPVSPRRPIALDTASAGSRIPRSMKAS